MRKIEQDMLSAIANGENWQSGNTSVTNDDEGITVRLHGHRIAWIPAHFGRSLRWLEVDIETLRRWPTVTTKSRLRALGVDLTQTKGKIYIDGEFICMV